MTKAAPIDTINTLNELAATYEATATSMQVRADMAEGNSKAPNQPLFRIEGFQNEHHRCSTMAAYSRRLAEACREGAKALDRELQRGSGQ